MAMDAGTLLVSIQADTARIKADMDAAKAVIGGAMKDVEQYVGYAKTALLGLVGVGSVAAFKGMVSSAIEGKAKLYDLSIQTGIAVEQLGALGKVAKYSNTDLDSIATASNKLSKALITQNEDSAGAALGLRALGIDFKTFRELDPGTQMLAVAKAMDGFKDGTGKAGVAMELFGKAGATLLPFMKELAERTDLTSKQTSESARQAHEYEKNLIALKAASDEWKRTIVNDLLPGLTLLTKQMVEANTAGGKLRAVFGNIADNAGFSALDRQRKDLENLGLQVKMTEAGLDTFLGIQRMLPESMKDLVSPAIAAQREEFVLLTKAAAAGSEALKAAANTAQGIGGGPTDTRHFPAKPELRPPLPGEGATKDVESAYVALMKRITEKTALDRSELASVFVLTDGQKLQSKILEDIDRGYVKLTLNRKLAVDGALQDMLATEKFNIAKKEEATWREQTRKAIDDELDTLIAKTRADRDAVDALQLQVDQYGLSADALQALSAARDRDTAATLRQRAAMLDSARDGGAIADQYRQQADAVERLANLKGTLAAKQARDHNDPLAGVDRAFKDYMDDVKRAGDATYGAVSNAMRGLEDLGVQALSGGKLKSAARQLVSGLLSEFERLYIIRPLIASIAGGGSGSGSSGWFGAASSLLRGYLSGGLSIDTSGYSANGGLGYASAAGISGGRAAGGGVDAGKSYLVGEKGPEVLRMGGQSGTVIPNDALGGGTRVDNRIGTINVGAGVTRGEMYSAIQAANAQQEMRQRRLSRQGSWA